MNAKSAGDSQIAGDTSGLRWASNMICLWCLCANPACRRARACKRDPRQCLKRYSPLVPEDARIGAAIMYEGRIRDMSYDEVCKDAHAEVAAVEAWIERANAAAHRRI
jgi:hypothetical protein